jgi:phosphatidylglycerol:prolipoprotein diacylglycerol transferase
MATSVALQIGSLAIHWYGLILAAAMAAAWQVARRAASRASGSALHVDAMVPWIVVLSLLGARLGEVLIFEPGYYLANPGQILAIWNGGLRGRRLVRRDQRRVFAR